MPKLFTVSDTLAWGQALGATLSAGDVVGLVGNLGSGKTHAAKGIVAGLGSTVDVSSPTFTLVHEYVDGRAPVFHFDFYRMNSASEVLGIDWDEYIDAKGIIIVEWADKFPEIMPENAQWFQFTILEDGTRTVERIPASSLKIQD